MQNMLQDFLSLIQKVVWGWWRGHGRTAERSRGSLSLWHHPGLVKYSGSYRLRSCVFLFLQYRQSLRCISCCPSFLHGFFSWAPTPERNQRILSHVNLVSALLVGLFVLFFLNVLLLTCLFFTWKVGILCMRNCSCFLSCLTICLLLAVFRKFTFNVIIDMVGF